MSIQQIMAWLQTWPGALVGLATLLAIVCTLPRITRRSSAPDATAPDSSFAEDADDRLTNDVGDSRDSTAETANHHGPDDSGLDLSELAQSSVSVERASAGRGDEPVSHASREFAMLHDCSADEWRTLLRDEPPQAIAVILSRLPPAQSAFVLRLMPAGVRLDIGRRMATLDAPSPTILSEFASVLEERLRTLRRSRLDAARDIPADSTVPPSARVNEPNSPILETLGRDAARRVAAPQSIPQAEFHDLRMLDDGSLRELFASFDLEHWAIALKGADDSIVTKLRDSLTAADALALQSALDQLGPVRLADVDAAQRAIAHELTPLRWRGRRTNRQRAMEEAAT
ncbi:MAG: hypothetical protein NT069_17060 [Planctomycetota bacterium]|nr:hypothetical protein [Planctomycetota bacterium]